MGDLQEIDVDRVVREIRERLRERPDAVDETAFPPNMVESLGRQIEADFGAMHTGYDVYSAALTSHRRTVGWIVVRVKMLVRQLLSPILLRQVSYNAANTRVVSVMKEQIELLERRSGVLERSLTGRVEALAREAEQRFEGVERSLTGRVEALAREAEQRTEGVERSLTGRVEALAREAEQRFEGVERSLTGRVEALAREAEQRFEAVERSLTGRVEALARETEQRFEGVERSAGRRSEVLEQAVERVRAVETRAEASAIRALVHQVLAEREDQWRALRAQVARTEGKVRRLLHQQAAAGSADPTPAVEDAPAPASPELDSLGFGEWFWGPPAEVRRRRQPYVELFVGSGPVLDVGCGRGEFLALLREAGVEARGIDEDLDMVLLCREQGLSVEQREALSDLRAQPEGSLGGVFAAHVVEHVEPAQAIEFVHLVRRALRPGGVLVLETPNPACLMTFASSFYMDFTHRRPFHPEALRFLALSMGFGDVEIRPLALVDPSLRMPILEAPVLGDRTEQFNRSVTCLNDLLFGAQDYALVARRP